MSSPQSCGVLETPYNFFVEHLAPLCHFLNIPIITSWPQTLFLFKKYYPEVEMRLKKWSVAHLIENYDSVLYSFIPEPRFKSVIEAMQQQDPQNPIYQRRCRFIHHFHGCSDKGYHSEWIRPDGHFQDLDLLIIYGQRMEQILKDKKLYSVPKRILKSGNYRYLYYLKFQSYFDHLVQQDVFSKFAKKQPTIFYAPTWQDHENSSSFFEVAEHLLSKLPDDYNLIVKLHPNMTFERPGYDPTKVMNYIEKYKFKDNVTFLPFYPLIYPLLKRSDIYIGDHSSVGYDALAFKIPMFFLNTANRSSSNPGALLFQTGTVIEKQDFNRIYEHIFSHLKICYQPKQIQLYEYAFGDDNLVERRLEIIKAYLDHEENSFENPSQI